MQQTPSSSFDPPAHDDLLWRQLNSVPAFRALLRSVEARFYQQLTLPEPLLDLGCGDGHFAEMTFEHPLSVGIDPWWNPLRKAQRSGRYRLVLQGLGDRLPFPDHTFATAISNSVLEHIPDIQPVLNEIGRVLQPGALFVVTMPNDNFTRNLGGAALLETAGVPEAADGYRRLFNLISRHAHTDPATIWAARLAQAGLAVERWQNYFSTGALRALELGHVQGLPAALSHALTRRWIWGWEPGLRLVERWVRPYYEEAAPADGAYTLIIARKVGDGPISADLPPAHPLPRS
jgi:SAM-dependent methyltransferase